MHALGSGIKNSVNHDPEASYLLSLGNDNQRGISIGTFLITVWYFPLFIDCVALLSFSIEMVWDRFYFFIGRLKGKTFLHRRPSWETKVERVLNLFDRYRTLVVLGFRFMYGLRTVTPFAFGLSGNSRKFLVSEFLLKDMEGMKPMFLR